MAVPDFRWAVYMLLGRFRSMRKAGAPDRLGVQDLLLKHNTHFKSRLSQKELVCLLAEEAVVAEVGPALLQHME